MSPALEGGFATIGPPEESSVQVFSDEIDGDISDYDVPILYIEFGRSL